MLEIDEFLLFLALSKWASHSSTTIADVSPLTWLYAIGAELAAANTKQQLALCVSRVQRLFSKALRSRWLASHNYGVYRIVSVPL